MEMRIKVQSAPGFPYRVVIGAWLIMITLAVCGNAQTDAPPADAAPVLGQSSSSSVDEDFAPLKSEEPPQPPPDSIETGRPLSALASPFQWGHLSLLSVTAYQGYDSAPRFQPALRGSELTALSFLGVYSKLFSGWYLDIQYQPFLWIAQGQVFKDLAGSSLNLRTARRLSRSWSWRANELVRYRSGQHSTLAKTFVTDFGEGSITSNPFLQNGRASLSNYASLSLVNHSSARSSWTFRTSEGYHYLFASHPEPGIRQPYQQLFSYGAGLTWTSRLNFRDTINLRYDYRGQSSPNTRNGKTDFHTAGIGWDHAFTPGLRFYVEAGPGWSTSTHRTTLQGTAGLYKEFRRGSAELFFVRTDSFSGTISNYFNNRYVVRLTRRLTTRWDVETVGSYVQQEVAPGHSTRGRFASARLSYFVTRNWSTFAIARYVDITGSFPSYAPEKIVAGGVRWAWQPDKE